MTEKQKQTFLGQAFEDEPFGFAYDQDGNLIPATEAPPLKVRMDDGRVLTAAEAERELFPEEPPLEPGCDDHGLVALIDKTAARVARTTMIRKSKCHGPSLSFFSRRPVRTFVP
jgi:hypothetical protein